MCILFVHLAGKGEDRDGWLYELLNPSLRTFSFTVSLSFVHVFIKQRHILRGGYWELNQRHINYSDH